MSIKHILEDPQLKDGRGSLERLTTFTLLDYGH